ncbi:MAG: DUF502 domain-containing protein [Rhodocyclaceae bacterium]|nr:DUF502 domain-containing protein [Rhodocyclaceae bacterium]MBK6677987.1 DUF502 domain-containing protein [Rhodocyclaceae bacterium]MBK9310658.1 DUF502 domain-containing protein [Rhodocyclaceae bacterium]MBK9954271.1 DUF502 domain-containing protein [Rhodocyclaceae bacterium]
MKKYFITGLLIWIPLAITVWVLSAIVGTMDQSLRLLPSAIHPTNLLGFNIPGAGTVLTLLVILLTGVVATNIIGQRMVRFWEALLARIPVVKSIYYSVKQISDTLFSGSGEAFRKVLLVRYPHPEAWAVAFLTGTPAEDVSAMTGEELVSVFIPTAPSPVNGFFFFVKKNETIELDMSVDDALKYIVSMGVVAPPPRGNLLGRAQNE